MTEPVQPQRPALRIVRGIPDGVDPSVEVAVLTAVLAARGGAPAEEPTPRSGWNARAWGTPDWRASALPR